MSKLDEVIKTRRQMALDALDEVEWEVKEVDSDDFGDTYWKYYAQAYLKNEPVVDDYFHNRPDDTQLYNYLLNGVKDGFLDDRIADILTQDDNYDKAEKELKGE